MELQHTNVKDIARQTLIRHANLEANMRQINVYSVGTGRYGINRMERFKKADGEQHLTTELFMIGFDSADLAQEHATYLTDLAVCSKKVEDARANLPQQRHTAPAIDPNDSSVMPLPEIGITYSVVTVQPAILPEQMPLMPANLSDSLGTHGDDLAKPTAKTTEKNDSGRVS